MNSPKKDDHWHSLAEEIGAEPIEESLDQPTGSTDTGPDETSESPAPTPVRKSRPQPERRPSDWNSLASQLGIEIPEPVREPAEDTDSGADDAGEVDDDVETPPSSEVDEMFAAAAADDVDRGGTATDEEPLDSGIAFFEPDEDQQLDRVDIEVTARSDDEFAGLATDNDADRDDDMAEPEQATPAGDGAEGGALATAPDELAGDEPDKRASSRRRRKRGRRRSSADDESQPDQRTRRKREAEDVEPADADAVTAELSADEVTEAADTTDAKSSAGAGGKTRARRRRRKPARRTKESDETDGDSQASEHEADDEEAESGARKSGERPKHRKIPTWEEAITVMVDANMERRGKSNAPKSSGRGGGRRRGRGSGKRG